MRLRASIWAVAMAVGGAAVAAETPPSAYLREPDAIAAHKVWPAKALNRTARVELDCTLTPQGTFTACKVASETPAKLGFGAAALKLAPLYAVAPSLTHDGRLTVNFGDIDKYDLSPAWRRKPTAAQLQQVWPTEAARTGATGEAAIRCKVSTQGTLRACQVASEDPAGKGWGQAALALAPQFLMSPAMKDGRAVEYEFVVIPVRWAMNSPGALRPGRKVAAGVVWSDAPSHIDMVAAYPRKAAEKRVGGHAVLNCRFDDKGGLTSCRTLREDPGGLGIGAAARTLTSQFRGPTQFGDKTSTKGVSVDVRFAFAPEILNDSSPLVGKPRWARLPVGSEMTLPKAALDAKVSTGRVELSCRVGDAGVLSECKVSRETPAGLGLGAEALKLSGKFAVSTWTEEGLPVIGGRVTVPIRYELGTAIESEKAPGP